MLLMEMVLGAWYCYLLGINLLDVSRFLQLRLILMVLLLD